MTASIWFEAWVRSERCTRLTSAMPVNVKMTAMAITKITVSRALTES